VLALRQVLNKLDLTPFATRRAGDFRRALDLATRRVAKSLPQPAQSWGLARKCLNIYLRDCFYSRFLSTEYGLGRSEKWYEIPLDSVVAKGLRNLSGHDLPRWPGVRYLEPDVSDLYQAAATSLSRQWGITRVHLDTYLWVTGRAGSG